MLTASRPGLPQTAARRRVRVRAVKGFLPRPTVRLSVRLLIRTAAKGNSGNGGDSGPYQPGNDGYDGRSRDGSKSAVFGSDVVMREFELFWPQMLQLSKMSSKFPDFDLEGKKMYLARMQEMVGHHEVFMKRFELSSHPQDKEYLRATNAQMLNAGSSVRAMFEGAKQRNLEYLKWVEEEEAASADPVKHQEFLQMFKERWRKSALGTINMIHLASLLESNPQVTVRAQADPKFFVAMKEIFSTPTTEVMNKWVDHPAIGPYVREIMRSMHA